MLTGWDVWDGVHGDAPPPAPGQWWVAEVFDADDGTGNLIATPVRRACGTQETSAAGQSLPLAK